MAHCPRPCYKELRMNRSSCGLRTDLQPAADNESTSACPQCFFAASQLHMCKLGQPQARLPIRRCAIDVCTPWHTSASVTKEVSGGKTQVENALSTLLYSFNEIHPSCDRPSLPSPSSTHEDGVLFCAYMFVLQSTQCSRLVAHVVNNIFPRNYFRDCCICYSKESSVQVQSYLPRLFELFRARLLFNTKSQRPLPPDQTLNFAMATES